MTISITGTTSVSIASSTFTSANSPSGLSGNYLLITVMQVGNPAIAPIVTANNLAVTNIGSVINGVFIIYIYGYTLTSNGVVTCRISFSSAQSYNMQMTVCSGVNTAVSPTSASVIGSAETSPFGAVTNSAVLAGSLFFDYSAYQVANGTSTSIIATSYPETNVFYDQPVFGGLEYINPLYTRTTSGQQTYTVTNSPDSGTVYATISFGLFAGPVCYSGKSLVLTQDKTTNIVSEIPAESVISEKHLVYSVRQNKFIDLYYNIVSHPTNRFRLIAKDTIATNQPSQDFYVTNGHYLVINGVEMKARDVPGAKRVVVDLQPVYSACTKEREPISVNGLQVMSWSVDDWLKYVKNNNIEWHDNVVDK